MTNQMDWLLLRGTVAHVGAEFLDVAPFDERAGAINRILPMLEQQQDRRLCSQYFVRCCVPFSHIIESINYLTPA